MHLEQLDIRADPDFHHRLRGPPCPGRPHRPLELGTLPRRIFRPEGLIDQLAAKRLDEKRLCRFNTGYGDGNN
jgi:hypothetical protein